MGGKNECDGPVLSCRRTPPCIEWLSVGVRCSVGLGNLTMRTYGYGYLRQNSAYWRPVMERWLRTCRNINGSELNWVRDMLTDCRRAAQAIICAMALAYQIVEPHKTGWHFPTSKKPREGSVGTMTINAFGKYVLVAGLRRLAKHTRLDDLILGLEKVRSPQPRNWPLRPRDRLRPTQRRVHYQLTQV